MLMILYTLNSITFSAFLNLWKVENPIVDSAVPNPTSPFSCQPVTYGAQQPQLDDRIQQLETKLAEQGKLMDQQRQEIEAKDRAFAEHLQRLEAEGALREDERLGFLNV